MKFKRFIAYHDGKKFVMEEDLPEVGVCLFIYSEDKGYDYVQDSFERCKKFAYKYFGVPLDIWKEIEPVEVIDGKQIDPLENVYGL